MLYCWTMWVWCATVVDVESREMWTVAVWCGTCALRCGGVKWWCRGRLQCNVISDIENMVVRGEMCFNTMSEMWRGTLVCSNVMWNVVQWWCDVEWCGVVWNGVTWKVVWCKIFWRYVMECCVMWKREVWSWVVWCTMQFEPFSHTRRRKGGSWGQI